MFHYSILCLSWQDKLTLCEKEETSSGPSGAILQTVKNMWRPLSQETVAIESGDVFWHFCMLSRSVIYAISKRILLSEEATLQCSR